MKNIFLIFLLAFTFGQSYAQYSFIPANPTTVMGFNLGTLGNKMDLNKISSFKMLHTKDTLEYVNFKQLSSRLIGNLTESGADVKQNLITIMTNDSMRASIYLIPLAASKKTIQVVENFNKNIKWEDQKLHAFKSGKVNYFMSPKNAVYVAVYNDLCVLMNGNYAYYYNNDEYEFDRAIDSVKLLIDSVRQLKVGNMPAPAVEPELPNEPNVDTIANVDGEKAAVAEEGDYEGYGYDDDSIMVAFRAWWEKKREKKEKEFWLKKETGVKKYLDDLHNIPKTKKGIMANNPEFAKQSATQEDVFHWVDFSFAFKSMVRAAGSYSYTDSEGNYQWHADSTEYTKTDLGKFLGDLLLTGHGNFNNGNTDMNYTLKTSDSVQYYLNQISGKGVNRKLFDYIKTPQIASLTSENINHKAFIELYFAGIEQYRLTSEKSRGKVLTRNNYEKIAFTAIELMYALIDKNMLFHTFSGNAISAVTGVVKTRSEYKSWEYDEEGNYVSTTKFKDEEYPKFVSIFEIENRDNLEKLLVPFVKNRMIVKNKNIYYFNEINTNNQYPIFMIKTNNAIIVTNDSLYTDPEYLNKPAGLDPNYVDNVTSMPLYFELNGIGTSNLLREMSIMRSLFKDKGVIALNSINKATLTCPKTLNQFNINFDFKNKNRCSLIDMMEMIDLMYD